MAVSGKIVTFHWEAYTSWRPKPKSYQLQNQGEPYASTLCLDNKARHFSHHKTFTSLPISPSKHWMEGYTCVLHTRRNEVKPGVLHADILQVQQYELLQLQSAIFFWRSSTRCRGSVATLTVECHEQVGSEPIPDNSWINILLKVMQCSWICTKVSENLLPFRQVMIRTLS